MWSRNAVRFTYVQDAIARQESWLSALGSAT